ncbi:uncharacterized protein LOC133707940 [Rosa rugosa]|uniref:uncharacterized protein LOC133707940 n=1 Tax=Rosa rugosa TaxID=74645 RepID=UPI002B404FCA|nr:uncharacterized protein LOC133707940 [Rosa rugosa]XP_061989391.1 uncharacterized protein LOC133707940 [Rosa rugosa]XP_061989392.1 uncharacterized protein LOC133707940 [Rosa rugosa]XP_061989393.1 uncharacterized protein LOC133707940 [Rosa rugosa]
MVQQSIMLAKRPHIIVLMLLYSPEGCYTCTPYGSCIQPKKIFSSHVELFGRVVELLETLEAMAQDNQPIPLRAMILSRKYRTLVSSWIELLQEEAELGHDIDYMVRYIVEGGLTGECKRWVPRRGKTPLDPDADGLYILTLYCKGRAYC